MLKLRLNWNIIRGYCSPASSVIKCDGITYYPRFPEKENPPVERPKVFLVQRVKTYMGRPKSEKQMLYKFNLTGKMQDFCIVKNTPENNAKLWTIKHLVRITPITFPNGVPTEDDIGATYLKETGELVVAKSLKTEESRLIATENFEKNVTKMDPCTLQKQLRLEWLNGRNV